MQGNPLHWMGKVIFLLPPRRKHKPSQPSAGFGGNIFYTKGSVSTHFSGTLQTEGDASSPSKWAEWPSGSIVLVISVVGKDATWSIWPASAEESQHRALVFWRKAMPPVAGNYLYIIQKQPPTFCWARQRQSPWLWCLVFWSSRNSPR